MRAPRYRRPLMRVASPAGVPFYRPASTLRALHLRSGVRLYFEAGATLFASLDGGQFDPVKSALIFGEGLHDVALEGRGTLDGQSSYEWRANNFNDDNIRRNQLLMEATGKPLRRPFPSQFPQEKVYPHLVLLLRCQDVRISGLKFLRSRSWTINMYAGKRIVIDGIYVYSSGKEGVWADTSTPTVPGFAHRQLHYRDWRRRYRILVFGYLGAGIAHRKRYGHQLPAVFGLGRAEVLRWQLERDSPG